MQTRVMRAHARTAMIREHLSATSHVVEWRSHLLGNRWEGWALHHVRPGWAGYILFLFEAVDLAKEIENGTAYQTWRSRILRLEPAWSATPTLRELRDLAGPVDWKGYKAGYGEGKGPRERRRGLRAWQVGPRVFDFGLLACGLSLLPDVSRVSMEVVADPATGGPSALIVDTPASILMLPPLERGYAPRAVLEETWASSLSLRRPPPPPGVEPRV